MRVVEKIRSMVSCVSFFVLLAGLLGGCTEQSVGTDAGTPDLGFADVGFPKETVHLNQWHPETLDDLGSASLEPVEQIACRKPQRMSVDQIRRSVPHIMAGAYWDYGIPPATPTNILDLIARTLGEADYISSNSDDREVSPLFMKFMDNMASKVCINAILHDNGAAEEDRVVRRYTDPAENLRYLRLKFHGIWIPPNSTEGIEDLLKLYSDLEAHDPFTNLSDPEVFQWYGVCVAMLSSPEFFAY